MWASGNAGGKGSSKQEIQGIRNQRTGRGRAVRWGSALQDFGCARHARPTGRNRQCSRRMSLTTFDVGRDAARHQQIGQPIRTRWPFRETRERRRKLVRSVKTMVNKYRGGTISSSGRDEWLRQNSLAAQNGGTAAWESRSSLSAADAFTATASMVFFHARHALQSRGEDAREDL